MLAIFCIAVAVVVVASVFSGNSIPSNVGYPLYGDQLEEVKSNNSQLIDYAYLTPNATFPREDQIKKITIHHMGGDSAIEDLGKTFQERDRQSSSNYAIGNDGRVAMYVEEENRAWTSSSRENDAQAITIEVANDGVDTSWHIGDAAYKKLIDLIVDICQRNGIEELLYTGDSSGNLTYHQMFNEDTICPGPYLISKMPDIAAQVNERLRGQ